MLECFKCNFEMFRILLYNIYCSNVEVISFCKNSIDKMAFLHTNPLNFTHPHLQKQKPESIGILDLKILKELNWERYFVYCSAVNLLL